MSHLYLPKNETRLLEKITETFQRAHLNEYGIEVLCEPLNTFVSKPRFEDEYTLVDIDIVSSDTVYPGLSILQKALNTLVSQDTKIVRDESEKFFLSADEVVSGVRKIVLETQLLRVKATYVFGSARQRQVIFSDR